MFELIYRYYITVWFNNRLPNQLLLSSEIGPFEDQSLQKSMKSDIFNSNLYRGFHMDLDVFRDFWKFWSSNGSISELKRSWLGKRLMWRSNWSMYSTFSRCLGLWRRSRDDFWRSLQFFPFIFTYFPEIQLIATQLRESLVQEKPIAELLTTQI